MIIKTLFTDFGHLNPFQEGQRSLVLPDKIENITSQNANIILTFPNSNPDDLNVVLTVKGAASGEIIWDEVILTGNNIKICIRVLAYWSDEIRSDNPVQAILTSITENVPNLESIEDKTDLFTDISSRTYLGHRCNTCDKVFKYDLTKSSWQVCDCNWFMKTFNILRYYYRELRSGYKEIPSYIQSVWNIVIGKERM